MGCVSSSAKEAWVLGAIWPVERWVPQAEGEMWRQGHDLLGSRTGGVGGEPEVPGQSSALQSLSGARRRPHTRQCDLAKVAFVSHDVLRVLLSRWENSSLLERFVRHANEIMPFPASRSLINLDPFPSGRRRKSTCEASVDTRNTAKSQIESNRIAKSPIGAWPGWPSVSGMHIL